MLYEEKEKKLKVQKTIFDIKCQFYFSGEKTIPNKSIYPFYEKLTAQLYVSFI